MPYVTMRDNKRVFVRMLGRGKPVVLLHGFAMQSLHWLPFIWPYLKTHQFIMPDFRGFGRSHKTDFNQDCVLTNYIQDLDDLAGHLELSGFSLCGISMGAYTALHYLSQNGSGVDKCCLIDQAPQALNGEGWPYGLFGQDQEARMEPVKELLEEAAGFSEDAGFHEIPRSFRKKVGRLMGDFAATAMVHKYQKFLARLLFGIEPLARRIMPADNWRVIMHVVAAYLEQDYDMRPYLPELQVPLTVMVAVPSEMYPCQGQYCICDQAPNARLVRFEKSGHAIPMNEPVKFTRELGRFLSS
jgi:non-heme chloroperoxidase